jgi:hypothetical protein
MSTEYCIEEDNLQHVYVTDIRKISSLGDYRLQSYAFRGGRN